MRPRVFCEPSQTAASQPRADSRGVSTSMSRSVLAGKSGLGSTATAGKMMKSRITGADRTCLPVRSVPHKTRLSHQRRRAAPINLNSPTQEVKAEQMPGAYFVAANNFRVKPEHARDFEAVWRSRDSHLKDFSGFIRFALLRCDELGEYISQTTWASREDFDTWRNSSAFQQAHGGKPGDQDSEQKTPRASMGDMLQGRPQPKFYEAVTTTEASLI